MLTLNTIIHDRYRIDAQLSEGGMGTVYHGFDIKKEGDVAIKIIRFEHNILRKALEEEANLLKRLKHDSLPVVLDTIIENGNRDNEIFLLVMEFIDGEDLAHWIEDKEGKISPSDINQVLNWANQLLEVVEFLHNHKTPDGKPAPIIHRDIKPANLKINQEEKLVLLDFGLAKEGENTKFHGFSYTAPIEQLSRKSTTDERSDIYAIGATLYHLLTGIAPAEATTRAVAIANDESDPLRPANELNSDIPKKISEALTRAMNLKKENRFQSIAEMKSIFRPYTPTILIEDPIVEKDDLLPPLRVLPTLDKDEIVWELTVNPRSTATAYQVKDENEEILATFSALEFKEKLIGKTSYTRFFYAVGTNGESSKNYVPSTLTISKSDDEIKPWPPEKVEVGGEKRQITPFGQTEPEVIKPSRNTLWLSLIGGTLLITFLVGFMIILNNLAYTEIPGKGVANEQLPNNSNNEQLPNNSNKETNPSPNVNTNANSNKPSNRTPKATITPQITVTPVPTESSPPTPEPSPAYSPIPPPVIPQYKVIMIYVKNEKPDFVTSIKIEGETKVVTNGSVTFAVKCNKKIEINLTSIRKPREDDDWTKSISDSFSRIDNSYSIGPIECNNDGTKSFTIKL